MKISNCTVSKSFTWLFFLIGMVETKITPIECRVENACIWGNLVLEGSFPLSSKSPLQKYSISCKVGNELFAQWYQQSFNTPVYKTSVHM